MAESRSKFTPDWATSPGQHLEEWMDLRGLTAEGLSELCKLPVQVIEGILSGTLRLTAKTAEILSIQMEVDVELLMNIENNYRRHLQRRARAHSKKPKQDFGVPEALPFNRF